ncbi:C40 family peptidase [Paenibacillus sp. N1-5-1-14]|uniref:C40 family peptidase n=1 Tax=Paenibacillus radicibacter TaxID=2972488 RepID=UPI002158CABD|nr:C40 family peptidase [Paenibacillus radicibacter]MCR8642758.1 C40 family peptidase [Paenibacillus radicibacter]
MANTATATPKWKKLFMGVSLTVALLSATTMITTAPVQAAAASSKKTASQKADAIIKDAKALASKVQYKYGKNDPKRFIFDCSSFTKYLYQKQGVNLKWGSALQSKQGTPIKNAKNLKKGDLVHFSVGTPGKIAHVGIYIGDGKFIHNLNEKSDVVISDMSKGYWKNKFITGTRVLK